MGGGEEKSSLGEDEKWWPTERELKCFLQGASSDDLEIWTGFKGCYFYVYIAYLFGVSFIYPYATG